MAKTQDEQFAAEEAAKQYVSGKQQAASDESFSGIDFDKTQHATAIIPAKIFEVAQETPMRRKVASCTLAHGVSIRGSETRSVSEIKLDYRGMGLVMTECHRGIEISYVGTDTKRYTFITPWANVVQFIYAA